MTTTTASSQSAANIRMEICRSCPYARKNNLLGVDFITCGKFMTGETVRHNGKDIHLCGCVMWAKTIVSDILNLNCPAERW